MLDGEAAQQVAVPPCRSDMGSVPSAEPVSHLDRIRQELIDRFGDPPEQVWIVGWQEEVALEPELRIQGAEAKVAVDGDLWHRLRERQHRGVIPGRNQDAQAP